MSGFNGFMGMVEASQRSINPEEQYRKNEFPQICTSECQHKTCAYNNIDHYGKPCEMQWEPKKTQDKASLPLEREIKKAISKAFEPVENRLRQIERQANLPVNRSFNTTPTFNGKRKRVDIGTNQENIHYE